MTRERSNTGTVRRCHDGHKSGVTSDSCTQVGEAFSGPWSCGAGEVSEADLCVLDGH